MHHAGSRHATAKPRSRWVTWARQSAFN